MSWQGSERGKIYYAVAEKLYQKAHAADLTISHESTQTSLGRYLKILTGNFDGRFDRASCASASMNALFCLALIRLRLPANTSLLGPSRVSNTVMPLYSIVHEACMVQINFI